MTANLKDQIQELKEEDKRLNNIIIAKCDEIVKLKHEIKKQKEIIRIQNEIIDSYKELAMVISAKWYTGDM